MCWGGMSDVRVRLLRIGKRRFRFSVGWELRKLLIGGWWKNRSRLPCSTTEPSMMFSILTLARKERIPLITADERFVNVLKPQGFALILLSEWNVSLLNEEGAS